MTPFSCPHLHLGLLYCKTNAQCNGKRIFIIGQYLVKTRTSAWHLSVVLTNGAHKNRLQQEYAAVEGLLAMGPSLQLSTCVLPHGDSKCCHLVNHLDLTTLHGERALVVVDSSPTTQLAAVTLTFDPEIGPRDARVPEILPTKFGIRRPFRFPSRWRHGTDRQTDGRTGSTHDGPPSRKDGPIKTKDKATSLKIAMHDYTVVTGYDYTSLL